MTDTVPLPDECPICRSKDIRVHEGSTFRWRYAICDACGLQGDEVRIQTLGEGGSDRWEAAAKLEAIADMHRIYNACTGPLRAALTQQTEVADPGVKGYAMALNEVALELRARYSNDLLSTPLWAEFEKRRNKFARSIAAPATPPSPSAEPSVGVTDVELPHSRHAAYMAEARAYKPGERDAQPSGEVLTGRKLFVVEVNGAVHAHFVSTTRPGAEAIFDDIKYRTAPADLKPMRILTFVEVESATLAKIGARHE